MKRFFTILLLIAPLCVSAENYFTEGTQWEVIITTPLPFESRAHVIYSLESPTTVAGYECLGLYCAEIDKPDSKVLTNWIRTEGEKVYFLKNDDTSEDWSLLYDFGIQPGGIAEVKLAYLNSDEPFVMMCEKKTSADDYGGFPSMTMMDVYEHDVESYPSDMIRRGVWLDGLGSHGGPLFNGGYDLDGGPGCLLLRATRNGETICSFRGYSGIPDVPVSPEALEEPAVCYDMQGRPAQPDKPGIYIRKSPQATSKTIVR